MAGGPSVRRGGALSGSEQVREREEEEGGRRVGGGIPSKQSKHQPSLPHPPKLSPRDNLRDFFETCFPTLLREVFGFDGPCWLTAAAAPGAARHAAALLRLLHPAGPLLTAARAADDEGAVLFAFPRERLPARTQLLLAGRSGRTALAAWPQYPRLASAGAADTSRPPPVLLDVFTYYVAWAAYFAAGQGGGGGAGAASVAPGGGAAAPAAGTAAAGQPASLTSLLAPSGALAGLGRAVGRATSASGCGRRRRGCGPYQRLVADLLNAFLPHDGRTGAAVMPLRAGGGIGGVFGASGHSATASGGDAARGRVLASILTEFWLTDADEPEPGALTNGSATPTTGWDGSAGGGAGWALPPSNTSRPLRAFPFEPPGEEAAAALVTLTRHVTADWRPGGGPSPALALAPWLPPLPPAAPPPPRAARRTPPPPRLSAAASPPAQAYGRSLYRFLARALTGWPPGRSLGAVSDVWMAGAAPWAAGPPPPPPPPAGGSGTGTPAGAAPLAASGLRSHLSSLASEIGELATRRPSSAGERAAASALHHPPPPPFNVATWEAHILAYAPLWTGLLAPFVSLVAARAASATGPAALADLTRILHVLASSPGLVDLLTAAEAAAAAAGGGAVGGGVRLARAPSLPHPSSSSAADAAALADVGPFLADAAAEWAAAAAAGAAPGAGTPRGGGSGSGGGPPPPLFGTDASSLAARVRAALSAAEAAAATRPSTGRATTDPDVAACRAAVAAALPRQWAAVTGGGGAATTAADAATEDADAALDEPVPGALRRARPGTVPAYRGDWARRPVGRGEVGVLVRPLLAAGDVLNASLGLGGATPPPPTGVPILDAARQAARDRGLRINLRPFAEKATLFWLPVAWAVWKVVAAVLSVFWAVLGAV